MNQKKRWVTLVLYAIAMAWVESAVAYYLRTMMNQIDPYHAAPLHLVKGLSRAEIIREAATLVMLFTVGWLSGTHWRARIGYMFIAFGVWDIFYYVFLKVMCGWPNSIWNWDLLFLIPLPWWGPVIAPCCIAMLMILGGTLVTQFNRAGEYFWPGWRAWLLSFFGAVVALYVFMEDTIRAVPQGGEAVRNVLPERFDWPWFLVGLCLMAVPVMDVFRKVWKRKLTIIQTSLKERPNEELAEIL